MTRFNTAKFTELRRVAGLAREVDFRDAIGRTAIPVLDERTGLLYRQVIARALHCAIGDLWEQLP